VKKNHEKILTILQSNLKFHDATNTPILVADVVLVLGKILDYIAQTIPNVDCGVTSNVWMVCVVFMHFWLV